MPTRTALGPDVVNRQVALSLPALSPDGTRVVYVRRTVQGGAYRAGLWIVSARGGRPRRLTGGAHSDTHPSWSPDGRTIAFLSDRGESHVRGLYLIDPDGGEAELVCGAGDGLEPWPPAFSPDGRRIAFTAWSGDERFWVGPAERRLARVIRTVDWRDDSGEPNDRRARLHVVAARAGARPAAITGGGADPHHPAWHPDGTRIAFDADPGEDADINPCPGIFEVDAGGGEPRQLVRLAGSARLPSWSPDGSALAFVGIDVEHAPDWAEPELWLRDAGGRTHTLTHHLDLPVAVGFGSDLHDWLHAEQPAPLWLDAGRIAVPLIRRGATGVAAVAVDGTAEPLLDGAWDISGLAVGGGQVVVVAADGASAPELYALGGGRARRLTGHGGAWLRRHRAPSVREVDAGGVPALVVEPAGVRGPSALVLHVHGGPWGAWGPAPELGDLLLADLGYRILLPNPRGSCGFGREWVRALEGRWGEPDAEDLRTATDWAIAEGLAAPDRLAVVGLSYGGWAANWVAATDPRFRCVVSENGVANMVSAHGTSSIGPAYDRAIGYGPVSTHADALRRSSPLLVADGITAPMLMLQGEADRICPLDDTHQLFVALRERGHDVELVLYPDEHHVMKATARPDRRIDRYRRIEAFLTGHCPP